MAVEKEKTALQRAAAAKLWRKGVLSEWKLDETQFSIHTDIAARRGTDRIVELAARGLGKTFESLVELFEECLQHPNHHTCFVTKTKGQAKGNIRQSAETILEDCPDDIRPQFLKNDAKYEFQNGSTLTLLGVDSERFDLIRGRAFHGIVIDESQSIDQLEKIVKEVLDPCVLRVDGWMLLTGTVPDSGEHDFVHFIEQAAAAGMLIKKTIYDCPRYKPSQIQKFMDRAGGPDSDIWRREYLCELFFSSTRRVIPEWTLERARELTADPPKPEHRDLYVGLDFAFSRDLTVALFAYLDFANATLVIEDELALKPSTTAVMATALEKKEAELWGPVESRPSVNRWADGNEARTIHELRMVHRLPFKATDKKAKVMSINAVRMLITEGRLIISPRCKLLLRTLMGASWDKNHKLFDRDADIGHADALDALLYLSRNVLWKRNPNPAAHHWTQDGRPTQTRPISSGAQVLRDAFSGKGKATSLREAVARKLKKVR